MLSAAKKRALSKAALSLIVEVEGYEGADGSITVLNERALTSKSFGVPEKLYCIGEMGPDGVIRFNDWGYATVEEAREVLEASARSATARAGADAT